MDPMTGILSISLENDESYVQWIIFYKKFLERTGIKSKYDTVMDYLKASIKMKDKALYALAGKTLDANQSTHQGDNSHQ